jgi:hypothetical protein
MTTETTAAPAAPATATPETRPAPVEVTTPIRPSEAIRLGCLTTTPGVAEFFDGKGAACALGAMAIGLGYTGPRHGGYVPGAWRIAFEALPGELPSPAGEMTDAIDAIWLRNDSGWSREAIASWLESRGL